MSLNASRTSIGKMDQKEQSQHIESSGLGAFDLDALDTIENTRSSKFAWLVSLTAGIGGLLFGYDTGIISAILIYLDDDLGVALNSNQKELITSITSGGAFIGSVMAGLVADKYGRKAPIFSGCFLFIAGAIIPATSYSIVQMTVGRAIVGLGVGSAAMVVPLYIAEVAPAKYRGRMMSLDNMSITGGQLISYGIGAAFASVDNGWRYMAGLGAVPAIALCCMLPFCPESPRQLVYHNKPEQAAKVIALIYPNGTDQQVRDKVQHLTFHVENSKALNEELSLWVQFKQLYIVPANFRACFAASGLMAISQLGGFNSLMYYSSTIFALVGFNDPVGTGAIIAATNFVFTWVNLMVVDRYGRRRILLSTMWGMAVALILAAVFFSYIPISHDLTVESNTVGWQADLVLVCMVVYVAFYATGVGNIAWLSSEFYPLEVRAMGTMMLTMSCWGANIIVASTYLTQMENTTPSGAYGFYAGVCFFGWIGVYFFYPEVKGMTLEDIREVFQHGFGVKYARNLQREMKQRRHENVAA